MQRWMSKRKFKDTQKKDETPLIIFKNNKLPANFTTYTEKRKALDYSDIVYVKKKAKDERKKHIFPTADSVEVPSGKLYIKKQIPDDFCWDPNTKSFGDPVNRPEIKHPTVEFIAPNEYMLRPPQPAVYVFVLDVSAAAVEAGYIYTFSEQLLINLDQLPGDDRTQVAFVCVDSMVHFYQFSSGSRRLPKELIVDEVDEMFLPSHQGILIPLKKNADAVRAFVEKLPVLFEHASSSSNCLGSALKIVHELIADIGGRVTVFQASIPNLGPASLKSREDPNQRAANDVQNLGPVTDFYKCLALECTGHQVALDLFMLNSQYADLATL
ncbi:Sec23/Sec24 trunk domain protein, partial [Teladorsagia circumcincta]